MTNKTDTNLLKMISKSWIKYKKMVQKEILTSFKLPLDW